MRNNHSEEPGLWEKIDEMDRAESEGIGAPGEIRTPDPLVRSQMLYPTELRAHCTQAKPTQVNLTGFSRISSGYGRLNLRWRRNIFRPGYHRDGFHDVQPGTAQQLVDHGSG
jgi:hypothetical protein